MTRGCTVLFTGLSGAGKSTIARQLQQQLQGRARLATLLDSDEMRDLLSPELGFSKHDHDLHLRRIAFVAGEVTRDGGIALFALIAPYSDSRRMMRQAVEFVGSFALVYVATPLDVCAARDLKGLYRLAVSGNVDNLTGLGDPYECPRDADVVVDMFFDAPERAAEADIHHLEATGYLDDPAATTSYVSVRRAVTSEMRSVASQNATVHHVLRAIGAR